MRFDIYDTNGEPREVDANTSPDRMRVLLSIFRTHCVTQGKAYEFNHFMNWLKKYYSIILTYTDSDSVRIDM
jgi:hypothetical protein